MALLNNTPQQYYDNKDFGNYQFVSLKDIINQFMLIYVGEDKIIPKAKRLDVAFHAQRALAELSFDTLRSFKSIEVEIPSTLQMFLPQDYVSYTKISSVDGAGIKRPLYPTKDTSNPLQNPLQDEDGNFKLELPATLTLGSNSVTLSTRDDNVLVGMVVSGIGLSDSAVINSVVHDTSTTVITLTDSLGGTAVNATDSVKTILQISNQDGSLIKPNNSIEVLNSLAWDVTSFRITGTAADIAKLKVGMLVYNQYFPIGTKIINIPTSTNVIVSDKPTLTVTSGQITFVDPDKDTDTWTRYKSNEPSENNNNDFDYDDDFFDANIGGRYGIEPSYAQTNGSFYINHSLGVIYFSSNISGQLVVLDYISDSLGTEEEMKIHKFAEEAIYKHISYAILSGKANAQEVQVQRLKKEKFAATRVAKLRLSNLNLEELTQVLRGKSKWIKR